VRMVARGRSPSTSPCCRLPCGSRSRCSVPFQSPASLASGTAGTAGPQDVYRRPAHLRSIRCR
jgi:hypothetical protein